MSFSEIQFGTDGWRARLGEGFTTDRFVAVIDALADTVELREGRRLEKPVVIAYDARFQAGAFARLAAARLADTGFAVVLADAPAGTPGVCASILARGAAAGIMITASHNPPEYLGVKIKGSFGGSAMAKQIAELTAELRQQPRRAPDVLTSFPEALPVGVEIADVNAEHLARLAKFFKPSKGRGTLVHDAMHGSGKGLLEKALAGTGAKTIPVRHADNPGFGGIGPEPIPERMGPMYQAVRRAKAQFGIATDGDADRVAACDAAGQFVFPHEIIALMIVHLAGRMRKKGVVVRNLATSELVRKVAEDRGLKVKTTPVGFKHIVEEMLRGKVLIGGEESGGIAIPEYLPERDGIMCGILLREIVLQNKLPLRKQLDALYKKYGSSVYRRWDLHIPQANKAAILAALQQQPPEMLGKEKVQAIDRLDGWKFLLPHAAWLLVRASGTEPILRVYVEAADEKRVREIHAVFTAWVAKI